VNGSPAAGSGRLPVTAAVLAGGRSQRMGTDKALLVVAGEPLVVRVCAALIPFCERVMVVAGDAEAISSVGLPPEVTIVSDDVPFLGPLGGLSTALRASSTEWVFAAGVDMPFIRGEVVAVLWRALGEAQGAGADVQMVMPVGLAGPEPLLALYRRDCVGAVDAILAEGGHKVVDLLGRVNALQVPADELRASDPDLASIINVNTAEDLATARRAIDDAGAGSSRPEAEGRPTRD
jgi:molybdopterin-guanine dinucleotide biosynthesis protein A